MTTTDRNDLVPAPAQEKLEWVTPNISLMDAGDTLRKRTVDTIERIHTQNGPS